MQLGRPPGRRAACLSLLPVLLLLATLLQGAAGQYITPLQGRNTPPANGTNVQISYYLDRLSNVDQATFQYTATWWFYLKWEDPQAQATIQKDTAAWIAGGKCDSPCDSSGLQERGCCDNVWLPNIEITNIFNLPQDRYARSSIGINDTDGTVVWYSRVFAVFWSPMDFRGFPFDRQHLLVELNPTLSGNEGVTFTFGLIEQAKATPHSRGQDVAGWVITGLRGSVFSAQQCVAQHAGQGGDIVYDSSGGLLLLDPAQLSPVPKQTAIQSVNVSSEQCAYSTAETESFFPPYFYVGAVLIRRVHSYHMLNVVIPVLITAWVVFVIFFLEKQNLDSRIGVIVTLFLALSALQFVLDFPPTSYLNAVQQVIVMNYFVFITAGIECVIVYIIVSEHNRRKAWQTHSQAAKRFRGSVAAVTTSVGRFRKRTARKALTPGALNVANAVDSVVAGQRAARATSGMPSPVVTADDAHKAMEEGDLLPGKAPEVIEEAGDVEAGAAGPAHTRRVGLTMAHSMKRAVVAAQKDTKGKQLEGAATNGHEEAASEEQPAATPKKTGVTKGPLQRGPFGWVGAVVAQLRADPVFAEHIGSSIDWWVGIALFLFYNIGVTLCLVIGYLNGRHRLELGFD